MTRLIKALLSITLFFSMLAMPLHASENTMYFRDYLLPRYKSKLVTYYSYNERNNNYVTFRSRVNNIRKIELEEGCVFVFQFSNGDEAVIPLKSTTLFNQMRRDDSQKITPGFLMSAKSYSENTGIIFGKEGQGSSMLADLEKNADSYNEKNNFTSKESIIYTDSQGNTNAAPLVLTIDGMSLMDNSRVIIGDIVMYDLNNLKTEEQDEEEK